MNLQDRALTEQERKASNGKHCQCHVAAWSAAVVTEKQKRPRTGPVESENVLF